MKAEVLLAIVSKLVRDQISSEASRSLRGPRGFQGFRGEDGLPGKDGKDFVWEDNEQKIRSICKEVALKFSDLTKEEIESLKGEDGKSFSWEEHSGKISDLIQTHSLKFEDLTAEQISALRGPKGRDGRDGTDGKDGESFEFDKYESKIQSIIKEEVTSVIPELKLKFSDLTEEEVEFIRGPRGPSGKNGKDFNFEDHREFFESLKFKFSDFTQEEIHLLKLKFSDLSAEEVESIKLKFSDLTEEEKISLRGPRGQRGKQGVMGEKGETGETGPIGPVGPRGEIGPRGIQGLPGIGRNGDNGKDGAPGKDAPVIENIEVVRSKGSFHFVFSFSDGSTIETEEIKIPSSVVAQYIGMGGGDGGSGGSGTPGSQYYFGAGVPNDSLYSNGDIYQDTDTGDQYKKIAGTWVLQDNITGPAGTNGTDGTDGVDGADGLAATIAVGTVTTGAPGSSASVTNVGTPNAAIFDITIPRGNTGASGAGTNLLSDVLCDSNVFVGSVVRLIKDGETDLLMSGWTSLAALFTLNPKTYTTKAILAKADTHENANAAGIVESKSSSTLCDITTIGSTGPIYLGLDVLKEYYLSDSLSGVLVVEELAPTTPGSILVKIGQPLNDSQLLVSRGERRVVV